MGIDTTQSSIETMGPSLGSNFWYQAQMAIVIAFIFMGIIVFGIFKTSIPSIAVILAAFSDIVITLAIMQIFGIELSLAGLAALLMLIGYSIDTDIMLTTRLLRGSGNLVERLMESLKTGLTMTLTTIGVLIVLILFGLSAILTEIASVLLIGLSVDIVNTWLQNSVLLRWHCERRGIT
jgi:preprotein translocase subunit SecF